MFSCPHLKIDYLILIYQILIIVFLYTSEGLILKFLRNMLHPDITNFKVNTCWLNHSANMWTSFDLIVQS